MYNWCRNVWRTSGTSLVLPLICVVLVTQEQMPNVTPNTMINIVRLLNVSKRQSHLTITMTVIATIIVTCQHTHETTAPLQLNRLQQATISWYWHSKSWSQTVVGQQDDRFIQRLPFLLAHMPKKVTACAAVPMNASDATLTTIIVNAFLSWGRGSMSCSCRHCVPAHLVFDEITNTM